MVCKTGIASLVHPCPSGLHGMVNVQGEEQQKLDILSNTVFINVLKSTGVVCAVRRGVR